ncbi:MAG: hypothetical protein K1W39_15270 [Lachnospiraceae bacterium]
MKIEYANTYGTCGIYGHAKSCLLSFLCGSVYEGISKSGIEVKVVSDECPAKSVAGT